MARIMDWLQFPHGNIFFNVKLNIFLIRLCNSAYGFWSGGKWSVASVARFLLGGLPAHAIY